LDSERVFNHFEFHSEISDKAKLLQNLLEYGKSNSINIGAFVPLTIIVDFESSDYKKQIKSFLKFYFAIEELVKKSDEKIHKEEVLKI
jgi:hypothetical protein